MRKSLPLLLSVFLLSGCASSLLKSDEPAPVIYSLRAVPSDREAPNGAKTAKVIEIQRPGLPPGFDTARMAMYLQDGRRLDYYAGAKWTAPLDETLQEFTSQNARLALPDAIIAAPGQAIDAHYRLQIKVNDFEPVYKSGPDSPPMLVASLTFTLLAMPEERLVTNFTVEQQELAQDNNLGVIVSGLERILQSVEDKAFQTVATHISR